MASPRSPTSTRPRPAHRQLDVVAAVALGGATGSIARYAITTNLPTSGTGFPGSTLLVNLTGSFLLGLVLVLLVERLPPSRYARAFLAVGILGGYTTFSSFVVDTDQLVRHHEPATAATFLLASVLGGLACAQFGVIAGRAVPHRHPDPPRHPSEPSP